MELESYIMNIIAVIFLGCFNLKSVEQIKRFKNIEDQRLMI